MINIVEQRIKGLNGGDFQKLCRTLVSKKRNCYVTDVGGVAGTNKTRGDHPDIILRLADSNKFILVECTSINKSKLSTKFEEDVYNCLYKNKAGINESQIHAIVFCYSEGGICPEKYPELLNELLEKHIDLIVFGIDTIAQMIVNEFPSIAVEHLNLKLPYIESIFNIKNFIDDSYNQWSPPLNMNFIFRENELNDIQNILSENDVVVLSGHPGVGKTKLGLEFLKRYYPNALVIKAQNEPTLEQITETKEKSECFLIDDAMFSPVINEIVSLLKDKKIILTVRKYQMNDLIDKLRERHIKFKLLEISAFNDKDIEQIILKNSKIKNRLLLQRISAVSKGNIRVAFIIVDIISKKSNLTQKDVLDSFRGVFSEYFSDRIKSLKDLNNSTLKLIGVLTVLNNASIESLSIDNNFFTICDFKNREEFLNAILRLKKYEIIDVLYNDVISISDQCLSNYLSFYIFIERKLLELTDIINWVIENNEEKVVTWLNILINDFYSEEDDNYIKGQFRKSWKFFVENKKINILKKLCGRFAVLIPVECLSFISEHKYDNDFSIYSITSNRRLTALISLVKDETEASCELLNDLVEHGIINSNDVSNLLIQRYGISLNSYQNGYELEKKILDSLTNKGVKNNYIHIINYSLSLLNFVVHKIEYMGGRDATIYDMVLPSNDAKLDELRKMAFVILFKFKDYYDSLNKYFERGIPTQDNIELFDKDILIINALLGEIKNRNKEYELYLYYSTKRTFSHFKRKWSYISNLYKNDVILLDQVLYENKEQQNIPEEIVSEVINSFNIEENFMILTYLNHFSIHKIIFLNQTELFLNLFVKNLLDNNLVFKNFKKLMSFTNLVRTYLSFKYKLVDALIKEIGIIKTYHLIIESSNFQFKRDVIFYFFNKAFAENVNLAEQLFTKFSSLMKEFPLNEVGYIKNLITSNMPITQLVDFIKTYIETNNADNISGLEVIFYDNNFDTNALLNYLYYNEFVLLKTIYVNVLKKNKDNYFDYNGDILKILIQKDFNFLEAYINLIFDGKISIDIHAQLTSIRSMSNFSKYINKIFTLLKNNKSSFFGLPLFNIFGIPRYSEKKLTGKQIERVQSYLGKHHDKSTILTLKYVLWETSDESSKLSFVSFLIKNKVSVCDFRDCLSRKNRETYSNSYTEIIEKQISFIKEIEKLIPKSNEYLVYRKVIKEELDKLESQKMFTLKQEALESPFR